MSFLSRRASRPDQRGDNAGGDRHTGSEYDEYDYAPGYQQADDNWSPDEYFSPEGIKGRWASGGRPGERPGGRGRRDDERGYDEYGPGPQQARGPAGRYGRDSYPQDSYRQDSYQQDDGYGEYGTGDYPAGDYGSGAYEIQDGADGERGGRRRRDRADRGGRRRLGRRDKGDDIWPDDGVSDEDYWASVAADRPFSSTGAADAGPLSAVDNRPLARPSGASRPAGDARPGSGRLGPAPGQSGYQPVQGTGSRPASVGVTSSTSGPMTRPGTGPNSGPMTRPGNGQNSGPMTRPGNGQNSGPMARPGTGPSSGPMTRAGGGPGSGPMARPGTGPNSGPIARPGAGANSGPISRPGTGPTPARPAGHSGGHTGGHSALGYGATGPSAVRSATGPTPARPATGPNAARPAAGLAHPGFGQPTHSQPTVAQPSLSQPGLSQPSLPSFQPNTSRGSARQPERSEWGERTERIDRISPSYPDPRVNGRSPAASPLSAPVSMWNRSLDDSADRRLQDQRERGRGGASAEDDPLTSKRFSREELSRTDGRSYRVASQRAQITPEQYAAALTEQTQTFSMTGGQHRADPQAATGVYPVRGAQQPSYPYDRGGSSYPYSGQPYPSRPAVAAADPDEDRYGRQPRPGPREPGYPANSPYTANPGYNGGYGNGGSGGHGNGRY